MCVLCCVCVVLCCVCVVCVSVRASSNSARSLITLRVRNQESPSPLGGTRMVHSTQYGENIRTRTYNT